MTQGHPAQGSMPRAPSRSNWATQSMYLGLSSFVLCCLTGIPAMLLGYSALSDADVGSKKKAYVGIATGATTTVASMVMLFVLLVTPSAEQKRRVAEGAASASASAGVSVETAQGAGAGEQAPTTRLEKLKGNAKTPSAFLTENREKLWVLRAKGERDCDGEAISEAPAPDIPSGLDQFERREAEQKAKTARAEQIARKSEIADQLATSLIVLEWSGEVKARNLREADGPLTTGYEAGSTDDSDAFPFEVHLSQYDFTKKEYELVLVAKSTGRWPIGTENAPLAILQRSVSLGTRGKTGIVLGGKELEVRGSRTVSYGESANRSRLTIPLRMNDEDARAIAKVGEIAVLILQRPTGVRFHKACRRAAAEGDSWMENDGIGDVFSAKTLGHEITIAGKLVASSYDEAELGKVEKR